MRFRRFPALARWPHKAAILTRMLPVKDRFQLREFGFECAGVERHTIHVMIGPDDGSATALPLEPAREHAIEFDQRGALAIDSRMIVLP